MRDNASTDTTPLPLSLLHEISTVTRYVLVEQETNSVRGEYTLFHGETLFVLTSHDLHDVSLEFHPDLIPLHLLCNTFVVKSLELLLIVDFNQLLASRRWVCNVQLQDNETGLRQRRVTAKTDPVNTSKHPDLASPPSSPPSGTKNH